MTSEAAALTEQIAELLAEHSQWDFCDYGTHAKCLGCDVVFWGQSKSGYSVLEDFNRHLATVLAARLADSRPAVTEAAIEAAAEAYWTHDGYDYEPGAEGVATAYRNAARAALSAALPYMGDGKADA